MDSAEFDMLIEVFKVWVVDNEVELEVEKWVDLVDRLRNYHEYHVHSRDKKPIEDYLKVI